MSDQNPPADHVVDDDDEGGKLEEHIKSRSTWLRLLYMVIYAALASIASMVLGAVVVLGFLVVLFTGKTNDALRDAGQGIASYLYQIIRFLTYNTDDKPFPFGEPWPSPQDD
ncbi:MAG: DUF4389 domain-containing protein [Woeseiaceae bacterium]|nr:DUF4389 domain-containing protein [Woeseiaceae bacterium]